MNRGFPLHLKTMFFPSGMSDRLTSILARANTSADADQFAMNLLTVNRESITLTHCRHSSKKVRLLTEGGGGVSSCSPHCSDDEIVESLSICPGVLALRRRVLCGLPSVMSEVWHRHVPDMSLAGCNEILKMIMDLNSDICCLKYLEFDVSCRH